MGFAVWFLSPAFQFSVHQCLFILWGDLDPQTSVTFFLLSLHVYCHLMYIYWSPGLLSFEVLCGRVWHLFPLCACWVWLPSYLPLSLWGDRGRTGLEGGSLRGRPLLIFQCGRYFKALKEIYCWRTSHFPSIYSYTLFPFSFPLF